MNSDIFYAKAKDCKFFAMDKMHSITLPEGVTWAFGMGHLRVRFNGKCYLLGISPTGYLQGFSELGLNPESIAELCLVSATVGGQECKIALECSVTPEDEAKAYVDRNLTPIGVFKQWFASESE